MSKDIAVIGAGMTGLAAAYRLAARGHRVVVYECGAAGGLNASFEWKGFPVDQFYRHIFNSDQYAIRLIEEVGLSDRLVWRHARMGMYVDDKAYGFETPLDLLRFSPFSIIDKFDFVRFVMNMRFRDDLENLEKYTAEDFMRRNFGDRLFSIVWKPLLVNKFGDRYRDVSMAWLWNRVKIRSSSRNKGGLSEQLGYLMGSFSILTDALLGIVREKCGTEMVAQPVQSLEAAGNLVHVIAADGVASVYDQALCAIPLPEYYKLIGRDGESPVLYQGAVGLVLRLKRQLTPFYWLSIADPDSPFGGIVEQTNLVGPEHYGGKHIAYLTKYLNPMSSLYGENPEGILDEFYPYLAKMVPDLKLADIEDIKVYKNPYAQPIVLPGYSKLKPGFTGHIPGVYIANMTHIYPEDRGVNFAIRTAEQVVGEMDRV